MLIYLITWFSFGVYLMVALPACYLASRRAITCYRLESIFVNVKLDTILHGCLEYIPVVSTPAAVSPITLAVLINDTAFCISLLGILIILELWSFVVSDEIFAAATDLQVVIPLSASFNNSLH